MISLKDYMQWYHRAETKFELIKQLWYREFALFTPNWLMKAEPITKKYTTRMLKCHSVQHLDFIYKALHIFELPKFYNFYYSLAKYREGIPNQTMDFGNRDNSEWKEKHEKQITEYDFLLDIDCETHKDIDFIFDNVKDIKALFNRLNVAYQLVFSGMGFHFKLPFRFDFNDFNYRFESRDKKNIYKKYRMIAQKLHNEFSELIDLSVYDSRRVCKLPYSLALYKDSTYVCYPFHSDAEFNSFRLEDYDYRYFIKPIYQRGVYTFNRDGNINKLLKHFNLYMGDE